MCNYLRLETTLRHSTFYRLGNGMIKKLCGAQGNYVPTTHLTYVHGGWRKRKSLSKGRSRLLGKNWPGSYAQKAKSELFNQETSSITKSSSQWLLFFHFSLSWMADFILSQPHHWESVVWETINLLFPRIFFYFVEICPSLGDTGLGAGLYSKD